MELNITKDIIKDIFICLCLLTINLSLLNMALWSGSAGNKHL